jgi:hypothetical protein
VLLARGKRLAHGRFQRRQGGAGRRIEISIHVPHHAGEEGLIAKAVAYPKSETPMKSDTAPVRPPKVEGQPAMRNKTGRPQLHDANEAKAGAKQPGPREGGIGERRRSADSCHQKGD